MDQQFEDQQWIFQDTETPEEECTYQLPFAEDLYEVPFEVAPKPKKVRAKRERKPRSGISFKACVALALVIALISSAATALVLDSRWQKRLDSMSMAMNDKDAALQAQISTMGTSAGVGVSQPMSGDQLTLGQVYERNAAAVVAIISANSESGYQALGSGFILTDDGYVVTNYHVIDGRDQFFVSTVDGATYEATVVGYDANNEFSLLKIEAEGLPHVTLGSSTELQVGDQVAAIGNPLGSLTSSMTVGYVSAKERMVSNDGTVMNMIQTDVAINSGNSGGPLFNMKGEVVGITTSKLSGLSRAGVAIEGISFAVPIDDISDAIEDLKTLGYISRAYLGVMVLDVDPTAQAYGLPAGAYVDEVTPGFAAEAAGMLAQDIITRVDDYDVGSVDELTRVLRKFDPGQTVSVTVHREGKEVQLEVTLDEMPHEEEIQAEDPVYQYPMPGDEGFEEWFKDFMEDYYG